MNHIEILVSLNFFGSYKGVIKSKAVYKGTNKDYLAEAKPRANNHFTCEVKPSKVKMPCPRAQRVQARHLLARINCRAVNKPPYSFLYIIRRAINIFLLDAKDLFIYAAYYIYSIEVVDSL